MHLRPNAHHRVQTARWLLKDDGDATTSKGLHLTLGQLKKILVFQGHLTPGDLCNIGQELHECQSGHGFATSGLTHQRKGLSSLNVKAQGVERLRPAALGVQVHRQVLDLQDGF